MLDHFRARIVEALGSNLVGVYLLGSALTADFQPQSSDVDFLVVTRHPLSPGEGARVVALQADLLPEGGAPVMRRKPRVSSREW